MATERRDPLKLARYSQSLLDEERLNDNNRNDDNHRGEIDQPVSAAHWPHHAAHDLKNGLSRHCFPTGIDCQ